MACSDGWLRIIGYTAAEALGRSSRHLHGPRTNFHAVRKVEEAMRRGEKRAWDAVHAEEALARELRESLEASATKSVGDMDAS